MIVDSMKKNGDYNECYDPVIDTLADLQELAHAAHEQLKLQPDPIIDYTDKNGNVKKIANPTMTTYFNLVHSVGVYLNMIGLGPK